MATMSRRLTGGLRPIAGLCLLCVGVLPAAAAEDDPAVSGLEFNWARGELLIDAGYAPDTAYTLYSRGIGGGQLVFSDAWSLDAVFRFDAYWENRIGDSRSLSEVKLDGQKVLLNWVGEQNRISAGYGIVRWGKTDEVSPIDRVAAVDFTRFNVNTLEERRRAVPMVRWQWFGDDVDVDLIYRPWFRKARMPAFDSIWSPVDRSSGRIAGLPDDEALAGLVSTLPFQDSGGGSGGGALRVGGNRDGVDWGVSLQRERRSVPYYKLETKNGRPTFVGQHPFRWVPGLDMSAAIGKLTMRAEAVYLSREPVTTDAGNYKTVPAWEAVAGVDWWPGDKDTLVVIQLAARWLDTGGDNVLDQTTSIALAGTVSTEWGQGDWEAHLRYFVSLNESEYYFNPKVTWNRFAPHLFTLGAHVFGGSERTVMGYYDDNDIVNLEWKLQW